MLEEVGELFCLGENRESTLTEIIDCDALMAYPSVRVDQELCYAPKLRFIGSPHTGKDHLDLDFIKKRDLQLVHIADERLLEQFHSDLRNGLCSNSGLGEKATSRFRTSTKTGAWDRENLPGSSFRQDSRYSWSG